MERLTGKDKEETYLKLQGCAKGEKVWCIDDREFINAKYGKQLLNKLCAVEDLMEKYGIDSVEELERHLGYTVEYDIITRLEYERDNWKKACELACDVLKRISEHIELEYPKHIWAMMTTNKKLVDKEYFKEKAEEELNEDNTKITK